ncbi:MAG TPA: hypothetical protein PKA98_16805, partial [Acidimicrobiales bacterium]|nr:hypothetical protein [Acidimicrobiales bacterium]
MRLEAIGQQQHVALVRALGAVEGPPGLALARRALNPPLLAHTCHNMVNRRLRLVQLYDLALVA